MSLRPALTIEQVREVRRARVAGASGRSLARRFGIDREALRHALYGKPPYHAILAPPPLAPGRVDAELPLTRDQVREVRAAGRAGTTILAMEARWGVSRDTLRKALYGRPPFDRYRDVPPLEEGPKQGETVLSVVQVRRLRGLRLKGRSVADLAEQFGVSVGTVGNALYGSHAYRGIRGPGPVRLDGRWADRGFTLSQVRNVRERARRGERTLLIARDLGVSLSLVERAVFGQGAYARVLDPPPLRAPGRGRRAFTDEEVRELRRQRAAGASFFDLAQETGVSFNVIRNAVYGRQGYRGIWYPFPPETGRDGGFPALSDEEVAAMRMAFREGASTQSLAKRYRVSVGTTRSAVFGHVPYHTLTDPAPLVSGRSRRAPSRSGPSPSTAEGSPRRAERGHAPPGTRPRGEVPWRLTYALMPEATVRAARRRALRGARASRLARYYGVSVETMRAALYGKGAYGRVSDPPPILRPSRGGTPPPEELQRLRGIALSCSTWGEFNARVGGPFQRRWDRQRLGIALGCALCGEPSGRHRTCLPRPERDRSRKRDAVTVHVCDGCYEKLVQAGGIPANGLRGVAGFAAAAKVVREVAERVEDGSRRTRLEAMALSLAESAKARRHGWGGRRRVPLSKVKGWRYGTEERLRDPESLLHDPEFVEEMIKTPASSPPLKPRARRTRR